MKFLKSVLKFPIYALIVVVLLCTAPIWLVLVILFGLSELLD